MYKIQCITGFFLHYTKQCTTSDTTHCVFQIIFFDARPNFYSVYVYSVFWHCLMFRCHYGVAPEPIQSTRLFKFDLQFCLHIRTFICKKHSPLSPLLPFARDKINTHRWASHFLHIFYLNKWKLKGPSAQTRSA